MRSFIYNDFALEDIYFLIMKAESQTRKKSEPREKDEERLGFKIDMVEKNFASSHQNVSEILAAIFPVVNRSIYT